MSPRVVSVILVIASMPLAVGVMGVALVWGVPIVGESRRGATLLALAVAFGLLLFASRRYVEWSVGRVGLTAAILASLVVHSLIDRTAFVIPSGFLSSLSEDFLFLSQTLLLAGAAVVALAFVWLRSASGESPTARARLSMIGEKTTMSPMHARLLVAVAFVPGATGLFWFLGSFVDEVLDLRDPFNIAAAFSAVVVIASWYWLWSGVVAWTPTKRLLTIGLIVLVSLDPALLIADALDWTLARWIDNNWYEVCFILSFGVWLGGSALIWQSRDAGGTLTIAAQDDAPAPLCPQCGYDLRGAVQARCPECGWTGTLNDVVSSTFARASAEF